MRYQPCLSFGPEPVAFTADVEHHAGGVSRIALARSRACQRWLRLDSAYASLRTTAAGRSQPNAFRRSAELAGILGKAPATVHRVLTGLLADGIVGRVNHDTAHLPSSRRY